MGLDFTEIASGEDFELLIASMLRALSWDILTAPGRGPDGGVDILVRSPRDPNTDVSSVFVVQCKHLASSGRAVGLEHLNGPPLSDLLRARGAQGYILVTSTVASQAVQTHFYQLNQADGRPYLLWDRSVIERKIATLKEPGLINRYFPRSGTALQRSEFVPIALPSWTTILSSLQARTLTDIQENIGQKYIPDLYVTRSGIEHTLDEFLDAHSLTGAIGTSASRLHTTAHEAVGRGSAVVARMTDPAYLSVQNDISLEGPGGERLQIVKAKFAEIQGSTGKLIKVASQLEEIRETASTLRSKLDPTISPRLPEYSEYLLDLSRIAAQIIEIRSALEDIRKANAELIHFAATVLSSLTTRRELGSAQERLAGSRAVRAVEKLQSEAEATAAALNAVLAHVGKIEDIRSDLQPQMRPAVVVVDRAGRGKTNLLCDLVRRRGQLQPTFFLAAKALALSSDSIIRHIEDRLRPLSGFRENDPIPTLAQLAFLQASPVVIVIDGINESVDPLAFAPILQRFLSELRHPTIRVVLTCREEYWAAFAPILPYVSALLLRDLDLFTAAQRSEAVRRYFAHYRIAFFCEAEALNALQDPLLLRFFCEAFGGRTDTKGVRLNHIRLKDLFSEYRNRKYAQIAEQNRELRSTEAVEEYVFEIARVLLQRATTSISRYELNSVIPVQDLSRVGSTYSRLLDEDIILEQRFNSETSSVTVNFTYEAFLEHVLGKFLLEEFRRQSSPAERFLEKWIALHEQFPNLAGVLGFYMAFLFETDRVAFTDAIHWLAHTSRKDKVFSILIALDNLPPEEFDTTVLILLLDLAFLQEGPAQSRDDALRILLRTPSILAHIIKTATSKADTSPAEDYQTTLPFRNHPTRTIWRLAGSMRIRSEAPVARDRGNAADGELLRWAKVYEHFGKSSPTLMWKAILLRFSTSQPFLRLRVQHVEAWRKWFTDQQFRIAFEDRDLVLTILTNWSHVRARIQGGAFGGWDSRARTVEAFVKLVGDSLRDTLPV